MLRFVKAIEAPEGIDAAIAQLYASGRITSEFVGAEVSRRIAADDF